MATLSFDELFTQLMTGIANPQQSPLDFSQVNPGLPATANIRDISNASISPAGLTNMATGIWLPHSVPSGSPLLDISQTTLVPAANPTGFSWPPSPGYGASASLTSASESETELSNHAGKRGVHALADADEDNDEATQRQFKRTRYRCETCHKCFTRPSSLTTHMYTHTGEKPHECTFPGCNKRFSVLSNLRRHTRLHLDPQPRRKYQRHYMDQLFPLFPVPLPHLFAMQMHENALADGSLFGVAPHFIPAPMGPFAKLPGALSGSCLPAMPTAPANRLQTSVPASTALGLAQLELELQGKAHASRRLSAPPMPAPALDLWPVSSSPSDVGGFTPSSGNCGLFM